MNFPETKQLLQQYYNSTNENLPDQREKSKWKPENNFGFLLGIIAFGMHTHVTQLHSLLHKNQFKYQEQDFIDSMFDCYILPFHKSYNTDSESCRTPSAISSRTPSRSNSAEDLDNGPEGKELVHKDLKKAALRRDGVCLFCWDKLECEAAHIIARKKIIPMGYDESYLLKQAGMEQKHQVQNGLLLCNKCHSQFDKLKRYVDVDDDKLVVKVVNDTNDTTSDKHRDWKRIVGALKVTRSYWQEDWTDIDNRQAVETNGEMKLYFIHHNATKLPNRNALKFHKEACLIWRMAGGAEPDDEYCSDDQDQGRVNTAALRKRFNLPAQNSLSTLNPGNDSESDLNEVA